MLAVVVGQQLLFASICPCAESDTLPTQDGVRIVRESPTRVRKIGSTPLGDYIRLCKRSAASRESTSSVVIGQSDVQSRGNDELQARRMPKQ